MLAAIASHCRVSLRTVLAHMSAFWNASLPSEALPPRLRALLAFDLIAVFALFFWDSAMQYFSYYLYSGGFQPGAHRFTLVFPMNKANLVAVGVIALAILGNSLLLLRKRPGLYVAYAALFLAAAHITALLLQTGEALWNEYRFQDHFYGEGMQDGGLPGRSYPWFYHGADFAVALLRVGYNAVYFFALRRIARTAA